MASFVTVKKSTLKNNNPGRPNPKSQYIIIFKSDDLASIPTKDADGVTVTGDIALKAGKKAIEVYATPSTINVTEKSQGDADKKGFLQTLSFEYPGSNSEFASFMEANVNENLMAIVVYPQMPHDKLFGWPGNPLQINCEMTDDNKEDTNKVTMESLYAGAKIVYYKGAFPATDQTSGTGAFNAQTSGTGY